jgi:glycosyltransferase involved in cell wall biosynthesis
MIRVLHIARYASAPLERRVMEMTGRPDCAFWLVRPRTGADPHGGDAVRDRSKLEAVRLIRVWRSDDPHRGLYQTLGFGIRRAAPDIIHAEEEPDSLAALQVAIARRLAAPRARLILNTWQNVNRHKRPAVSLVLSAALSASDAVICGNQGAVTVLREMGYRKPAPVIPALALDADIYRRRHVARFAPGFTVGCVARLVPEKGIDTALRALAALGAPAMLAVVGVGPSKSALEDLARTLGIGASARFLGPRDPDGVAEFLSAIDVLVVPSRSSPVWKEQFGRVIVEAMGCGTPVVGSASGAIPEVMGSAGLLFPEDDAAALAERLRELRASAARRDELAQLGRAWVLSAHSPARRAAETIEFYQRLLGRPAGATP